MAVRYARDRGCTASPDTGAGQTLSAGNSGHPEAASEGAPDADAAGATARVSTATAARSRIGPELSQNRPPAERGRACDDALCSVEPACYGSPNERSTQLVLRLWWETFLVMKLGGAHT
jgi:hypothetical protein